LSAQVWKYCTTGQESEVEDAFGPHAEQEVEDAEVRLEAELVGENLPVRVVKGGG